MCRVGREGLRMRVWMWKRSGADEERFGGGHRTNSTGRFENRCLRKRKGIHFRSFLIDKMLLALNQ